MTNKYKSSSNVIGHIEIQIKIFIEINKKANKNHIQIERKKFFVKFTYLPTSSLKNSNNKKKNNKNK